MSIAENSSAAELKNAAQYNPICKSGAECVGWGVDAYSGQVRAFPIIHLSYNISSGRSWKSKNYPDQSDVNIVQNPGFSPDVDSPFVFPTMPALVEQINRLASDNKGERGVFSLPRETTFDRYFQRDNDVALTVTRFTKNYLEMALKKSSDDSYEFAFDRNARSQLLGLPKDLSTPAAKAMYFRFYEKYGTSVVVSSKHGGVVEQLGSWSTELRTNPSLGPLTGELLSNAAQWDFHQTLGIGSAGSRSAAYETHRSNATFCYGSDPAFDCVHEFGEWSERVMTDPAITSYTTVPISTLITPADADLFSIKGNLDSALSAYVAMKTAAFATAGKCPPSCNRRGRFAKVDCPAGGDTWDCDCPCYYGRMCSGGVKTDVPACAEPCANGDCGPWQDLFDSTGR
jgi:hypothetical protein